MIAVPVAAGHSAALMGASGERGQMWKRCLVAGFLAGVVLEAATIGYQLAMGTSWLGPGWPLAMAWVIGSVALLLAAWGALFVKVEESIPGDNVIVKGAVWFLVFEILGTILRRKAPTIEAAIVMVLVGGASGALFGWLLLRMGRSRRSG